MPDIKTELPTDEIDSILSLEDNTVPQDIVVKAPEEVLQDPALLFLFYRIEQILGIKAGTESLNSLNAYIEKKCGSSFIKNPASYENLLTSREQIFEISKFLTINETYFFREAPHFKLLADFLPELSKHNRLEENPLKICSAGASIGCEAYSIAMLLDFYIKKGIKLDFEIDAFDVNNESIEIAKNARYTANALRDEGNYWKFLLDSYIVQEKNEFMVIDDIKRKVNFFPHNIMRGIEKQYDIIFFRNALIYFSAKNRHVVINNIAESLHTGGFLFLGISETSSINHPLLASRYSKDVFYFQKIQNSTNILKHDFSRHTGEYKSIIQPKREKTNHHIRKKNKIIQVYFPDIQDILKTEEGEQNARFVLKMINSKSHDALFGSQLAAAAIYYLQTQGFENADLVISYLEKHNSEACTKFLRGEYYYLLDDFEKAEEYYRQAAYKDGLFWPAFYRIAVLAASGNITRYEYKVKKTIESIELSRNNENNEEKNYECFLGGFSSEYFINILEKKLSERGNI